MSVWSWSLVDFDRIDTFEALSQWHTEALKAFDLQLKIQLRHLK